MSLTVTSGRAPGEAVIRVAGGGAAAADPLLAIDRGEDWSERYLGAGGWQKGKTWLRATQAAVEGADALLTVDWRVCQYLQPEPYAVDVPAAGVEWPVTWPAITPPHGGSADMIQGGIGAPSGRSGPQGGQTETGGEGPTQTQGPVISDPPPGHTGPPTAATKPVWAWVLALLLVLAVAAAAATWYFWPKLHALIAPAAPPHATSGAPQSPAQVPPPAPVPPTAPPQDDPDTMSVEALLARNKPDELTQQAKRRLAAHPQDAYRLLHQAADDDDGAAEAEFARRSDPLKTKTPPFAQDYEVAIKYYQRALARGADVQQDLEALHRALQQRDQDGDLNAHLALCGGWHDTPGCQ